MVPYAPLDPGRKEIRLLEIIPSSIHSLPLQCRLSTVSLLDNPAFAALSYVWGDPTVTEDVTVDGISASITKNLADALAHVKQHWVRLNPHRDPSTFRLWVDALCIHQSNLPEKGFQIPLMNSIYHQAQVVFSWLACGDEMIDTAFSTLEIIARETKGFSAHKPPLEWMEKYPALCEEESQQEHRLSNKHNVWAAIDYFKKLPNWQRVWTFQEIVLGDRVVFLNGSTSLDYSTVEKGILWHKSVQSKAIRLDRMANRPAFISAGVWDSMTLFGRTSQLDRVKWARVMEEKNISPWYLIATGLRASEPRDQIYGLLGVIGKGTGQGLEIDYAKPVEDVYSEAMGIWINQDQELTTIMCLTSHTGRDVQSSLPTWIPDLKALGDDTRGHFQIRYGNAQGKIFRNCSETLFVRDTTLSAPGVDFGTVTRVHQVLRKKCYSNTVFLNFCADYFSRGPTYITGERSFRAILRVLTTGVRGCQDRQDP